MTGRPDLAAATAAVTREIAFARDIADLVVSMDEVQAAASGPPGAAQDHPGSGPARTFPGRARGEDGSAR